MREPAQTERCRNQDEEPCGDLGVDRKWEPVPLVARDTYAFAEDREQLENKRLNVTLQSEWLI